LGEEEEEEVEMSQNVATYDYIFPSSKAVSTTSKGVSPIKLEFKEPPLRSISSNLAETKDNLYEEIIDYASKNYDRRTATPSNKYDYLAVNKTKAEQNTNVVSNMGFVYCDGTQEQLPKSKTANKSHFFKNRKKLIIFSSILFVIVIVVIIAVIMIVLATASKRILKLI
jgi:hypothetical protein